MGARIRPMVVAAVVLVLCRVAMDRGEATVVRDGKATNPAVQAGGQPLRSTAPQDRISYNLVGAIGSNNGWWASGALWPWSALGWFPWHRFNGGFGVFPGPRPGGRFGVFPRLHPVRGMMVRRPPGGGLPPVP